MVRLNERLINLNNENTFLYLTRKVNDFKKNNPDKNVISLGIGEPSKPIIKSVIDAMNRAVDDLSKEETFRGYNTSFGYEFLKEKILENEYSDFGFTTDEIYISNGTKPDSTNILELFSIDSKICITDTMYPIYKYGSSALNRNIYCLESSEENNFIPSIPKEKYDIIYICSPSNPTGICYNYDELKEWVDYAIKNDSVILYDNVYYPFISSDNVPKSIYEIEGSKKVAIEFRSFSKTISFTGVRCSYYIIPNEIDSNINELWKARTINRFNGADYIAQRGAEASYLSESKPLIENNIKYYKENTKLLKDFFISKGFKVYGGVDSPYIWVKIKENINSWELFDLYLNELNIIVIPGIIFGKSGDKFFRISGLGKREMVNEAIRRLGDYYE